MYLFIILAAAIAIFIAYIPELFPHCSCCEKVKPRPFIRLHRAVSISPGFKGNRSVCIRCCRKYDIDSLNDLDKLAIIKRRLKLQMLAKNDP